MTNITSGKSLRERAEAIVSKQSMGLDNLDLEKLVHELQVYQIELEMQNEELHRIIDELRRTEQSEKRYRTVVEDQTEIIARYLPDGTYTFVNEVYCRMFGQTPSELVGSKYQPVVYPDDLPRLQTELNMISIDNPVVVVENRVYTATGKIRWMQFVNRGFFDEKGDLSETQVVGRDITDLKQSESLLIDKETELEGAQLIGKYGSWSYDPATQVSVLSKGMFDIWGLDPSLGFVPATDLPKYIHPDDYRLFEAARNEALEHGTPYNLKLRINRPDGTKRTIITICEPVCDAGGKIVKLKGINKDITEREQNEQPILTVSRQLSSVLESSSDVIAMMDTEYRYTLFNNSFNTEFKKIFGKDLSAGDSMLQALEQFPDDLSNALKYWNRALGGEDFTVTQQFGSEKLERNSAVQ